MMIASRPKEDINSGTSAKEPVATSVLRCISSLAERSSILADRMGGKLNPVLRPKYDDPNPCEDSVDPVYPPLFHELRTHLHQIEEALSQMEETMCRVEL